MSQRNNFSLMLVIAGSVLLGAVNIQAQDYHDFGSITNDLLNPKPPGVIAQGRDGNMYSTAHDGGLDELGGIFKISSTGSYSVFWTFNNVFSTPSSSGITVGTDGNFYGSQSGVIPGGPYGAILQINAAGTSETYMHGFDLTHGADPAGPPIEGVDGNFYGTTYSGGNGVGTVYKITPSLVFTMLYNFDGTHGDSPNGPLVQGVDGNFYGTTSGGGAHGHGEVFKVTPQGVLSVLHSFNGTDGDNPTAGLMLAKDGNFYGTTGDGGANGYGEVFRISSKGVFKLLYSFAGSSDGSGGFPAGGLVQASDGNFYGTTTPYGGNPAQIYRLTPAGTHTNVGAFEVSDTPEITLLQHTSGPLYGDTFGGGADGDGQFYGVNLGLQPFAALLQGMSKAGKTIGILGQGFSNATRVSFNGVTAKFAVLSDTFLTATVPAAATTGPVTVVIPTGNLVSKQPFWVLPTIKNFTPASGPVTTPVTINGTSLKQTKGVTFGGVAATTFTVNSQTQIVADVPTGAKTGRIVVTTAGGVATSPTIFTVTP
jgi:uncharacterized repeat protein (TIGR03803 family)